MNNIIIILFQFPTKNAFWYYINKKIPKKQHPIAFLFLQMNLWLFCSFWALFNFLLIILLITLNDVNFRTFNTINNIKHNNRLNHRNFLKKMPKKSWFVCLVMIIKEKQVNIGRFVWKDDSAIFFAFYFTLNTYNSLFKKKFVVHLFIFLLIVFLLAAKENRYLLQIREKIVFTLIHKFL